MEFDLPRRGFRGPAGFGNFSDAGALAVGLEKYAGRLPAVLFVLTLINACIIGASVVFLSTASAVGDVLSRPQSLHRKSNQGRGFYRVYCELTLMAAALLLPPGTPLGLLTKALRPWPGSCSGTIFLLLCNDRAVLGPWVKSAALTGSQTR